MTQSARIAATEAATSQCHVVVGEVITVSGSYGQMNE